jgi:AMP deaminase
MDSASASSYKLQLAVAALVGASAAAASAYYLHCRAVARLGGDIVRSSAANAKTGRQQRRRQRDAGSKPPPPRRAAPGSSSLPDLSSIYAAGGVARGYPVGEEYDDDDEGGVGPYRDDALVAAAAVCCMQIPQGLPRLQVGPEGMFCLYLFTIAARVGMWRLAGCGVDRILGDELAWVWS